MRMQQRMTLSPRMIQSMEILQLPLMALEERIEQEMEENPLLEMVDADTDADAIMPDQAPAPGDDDTEATEQPMVVEQGAQASNSEDFQRLDDLAGQYGEMWDPENSSQHEYRPRVRSDGERDAKIDAMANTAARGEPLADQLLDQWRFVDVQPNIARAGEHLIGFIDDDGYLRVDMEQVLHQAPAGLTRADMDQAITEIQQRLEPTGIGARDLRECLLLQLDSRIAAYEQGDIEEEEEDYPTLQAARQLVADHLKDVEMNRLPQIARRTELTIDQIKSALGRLRRLDPHPGKQLAPDSPQVIVPDVIIEYDPVHDRYVVGLARGRTPSLRISPQYADLTRDRSQEKSTRDFLSEKMNNARWLIDSIDQRNNTLLRVVNAVLDVQRDFFDQGPEQLKPLPMIQVADQLGIHVGTVSRAVSEKYMQTPRGIFPLRMFFSGGTESQSGEEMSWAAVQAKLKQIVESEDPKKPWSDEELAKQLSSQGIDIARRTVAKYRQQMNIPPARRRRQY